MLSEGRDASPTPGDPQRSLARDPYTACECRGRKMSGPVAYEVRVVGQVGPDAHEALTEFAVRVEPPATVLSGTLDQAALHGLLARIQALGLELVDVRRSTSKDVACLSALTTPPKTER